MIFPCWVRKVFVGLIAADFASAALWFAFAQQNPALSPAVYAGATLCPMAVDAFPVWSRHGRILTYVAS